MIYSISYNIYYIQTLRAFRLAHLGGVKAWMLGGLGFFVLEQPGKAKKAKG